MIARGIAPVLRGLRLAMVVLLITITMSAYAGVRNIDSLNFVNADIPLVLKALADLSGANIVIGPAVKGAITVKLKDVTVDEALDIITKLSGLSYIQANGAYIINVGTPERTAIAGEYSIVELKNIAATDAIPSLGVAFPDVKVQALAGGRLVLSGAEKRLASAKTFIDEIDKVQPGVQPVNQGEQTTWLANLQYVSAADIISAFSIAYKDITITQLQDKSRLMFTGPAKRIETAKGLFNQIDVPSKIQMNPTQSTVTEKTYVVKYLVPWQAKQYLENLYQGKALTLTLAPVGQWTDMPNGQPTAVPTAPPAGNSATAPATTTPGWQSRNLILRGTIELVDQAILSLSRIDVELPVVEKRCAVKRIFPSQAINYLLDRFESRGLLVLTAPMTYVDVMAASGDKNSAVLASAQKVGMIGSVVQRGADGRLNVSEPIGDIILRGPAEAVEAAAAALATIDIGPERIDRIVSLRFLRAQDVKKQFDEMYGSEGLLVALAPGRRGETPDSVKGTDSTASSSTSAGGTGNATDINDLVLRGPEGVVTRAQDMLRTLDIEPAQVSIQAEIINIRTDRTKNLGVQWSNQLGLNLHEQQSGKPLELGRIVRDPVDLNATLNLLVSQNKLKVISRPSSVVRTGREAFIHVGEVVFYESFEGLDAQGNRIFSTKQLPTGITLKVRPIISPDGIITLEIASSVANRPTFTKAPSGADLPNYDESSSTTVVQVRNNETLVIGGLSQSMQHENRQEVPVLSRIPLIGKLFSTKLANPSQSELLILVRTQIIVPGSTTAPAGATTPSAQ